MASRGPRGNAQAVSAAWQKEPGLTACDQSGHIQPNTRCVSENGATLMTRTARPWVKAGLPQDMFDMLANGVPASRLWSLLIEVAAARAAMRRPSDLLEQWDRDRFVQHGIVDQRSLL